MAFSRALSVISIISVSWLAAVGCGDDDDNKQQPGAAGEGGEAGESVGGTRSGAGDAGAGGSAGDAGNGTGGTAGDAGHGSGGAPVTPVGGAAGEGGVGGAGGEPPVALGAKQCGDECEVDDDCVIDGAEFQKLCDTVSKRCYDPTVVVCSASADCIPPGNFWQECTTTAECDDAGLACVNWQGAGYCAARNVDGCEFPASELTLPEFGVPDSPVNVCVGLYGCRDGVCEPGCEQFGGCEGDLTCGEVSHLCECASATDCPTGVCGTDKLCAQCADSTDCPGGISGLDTCVEGKCGCSAASVCPDLTESATPVCE